MTECTIDVTARSPIGLCGVVDGDAVEHRAGDGFGALAELVELIDDKFAASGVEVRWTYEASE